MFLVAIILDSKVLYQHLLEFLFQFLFLNYFQVAMKETTVRPIQYFYDLSYTFLPVGQTSRQWQTEG